MDVDIKDENAENTDVKIIIDDQNSTDSVIELTSDSPNSKEDDNESRKKKVKNSPHKRSSFKNKRKSYEREVTKRNLARYQAPVYQRKPRRLQLNEITKKSPSAPPVEENQNHYNLNQKYMYTNEHKSYLYATNKFVIDRGELTKDDFSLWRIIHGPRQEYIQLRMFQRVKIYGRDCHSGTPTCKFINTFEELYAKYQPTIVKMLIDNDKQQIGLHYLLKNSFPFLGYFPLTDNIMQLFKDFLFHIVEKVVADEIIITRKQSVEIIEKYLKDICEKIIWHSKWDAQTLVCVMAFPKLVISKLKDSSSKCLYCKAIGIESTAVSKILYEGQPYDAVTLKLNPQAAQLEKPILPMCYLCPKVLVALHKLVHYKWWLHARIKAYIIQKYEMNNRQSFEAVELLEHFFNDFVFLEKTFFEFQSMISEAHIAIEKLEKNSKSKQERKPEEIDMDTYKTDQSFTTTDNDITLAVIEQQRNSLTSNSSSSQLSLSSCADPEEKEQPDNYTSIVRESEEVQADQ